MRVARGSRREGRKQDFQGQADMFLIARTKLYFGSGMINALFDFLTYNTSGHVAHCYTATC